MLWTRSPRLSPYRRVSTVTQATDTIFLYNRQKIVAFWKQNIIIKTEPMWLEYLLEVLIVITFFHFRYLRFWTGSTVLRLVSLLGGCLCWINPWFLRYRNLETFTHRHYKLIYRFTMYQHWSEYITSICIIQCIQFRYTIAVFVNIHMIIQIYMVCVCMYIHLYTLYEYRPNLVSLKLWTHTQLLTAICCHLAVYKCQKPFILLWKLWCSPNHTHISYYLLQMFGLIVTYCVLLIQFSPGGGSNDNGTAINNCTLAAAALCCNHT